MLHPSDNIVGSKVIQIDWAAVADHLRGGPDRDLGAEGHERCLAERDDVWDAVVFVNEGAVLGPCAAIARQFRVGGPSR
jgi:hypothetical protein